MVNISNLESLEFIFKEFIIKVLINTNLSRLRHHPVTQNCLVLLSVTVNKYLFKYKLSIVTQVTVTLRKLGNVGVTVRNVERCSVTDGQKL